MDKSIEYFDKLKKEILELIKNKNYNQILDKIDILEDITHNITDHYKLLFENSLSGIGIASIGGDIIDCNPALLKILGFSSLKEFQKYNIKDFYADFDEREGLVKELYDKGFVVEKKIKVKTNHNKIITALVNAKKIQLNNEDAIAVNFQEITNQEKYEKELVERETLLKAILESTADGILVVNNENKVLTANNQFFKLWEIPGKVKENSKDDELLAFVLNQLVNPDIFINKVKDLYASKDKSFDILNFKDGRIFERLSFPLIIDNENIGRVWSFRDITNHIKVKEDLKKLTEELEKKVNERTQKLSNSEEKYRSLIENLKHEYFFYRHNVTGVFEYVSPSIKNILGYSEEEFMTHFSKYLTDNPINKETIKKTELSIKGIQQLPYELEIFDSNKNIHILEVSETPLTNNEGNVIAVEGIAHDITSQKKAKATILDQLEEIQIRNEEIKSINEEIHAVNDDLERRIEDINTLNENLKISESKFRTLVRNIPGVVYRCLYDKNWTMQFISQEIEIYTGYPASDFIDNKVRTFASIIFPEDRGIVEDSIQPVVDGNESYVLEYRIVHKNGDIKWVFERGQRVLNDNKEVLWLDGVILDITEQKKIEEKLEQERKFSTGIINGTPSIICGISLDGSTNYINPAGEQIAGYKSEELIGKNWWRTLYPGSEYQQVEQLFIDFKNEDVRNYEMTLTTKEGGKRIVAWNSINRYDEKDEVLEIIGFGNDITERKKSELELKESEELYQKLVNNQGEALVIVDNDNKFIFVNPATYEIFGVSDGSLIGRNVKEFLTDEYITQVNNETNKRKTGITNSYELEILRPDKTKRCILVTASPEYNNEKEITGAFAIFRDITERKNAEEILFESEKKLRELNAQKDKFFSLLAHDLRSPIGNFLQISELLKLSYEDISKDQVHEFFDNLHSLASRTFKLLDNLLMWSRSQLGRLEIQSESIDLYNVVEDIVHLFEDNLNSKRIQIKNKLPVDLVVKADMNITQTLFRNLISNAIKFSYSDGEIIIASKTEIDKQNNSEYCIISVQDTGVGIPEDKIEKIFDMDDDYTTLGTASEKGTGLGLILCKELIEKSGEKIWVGSREGNLSAARLLDEQGRQGGTTFCFTLRR